MREKLVIKKISLFLINTLTFPQGLYSVLTLATENA